MMDKSEVCQCKYSSLNKKIIQNRPKTIAITYLRDLLYSCDVDATHLLNQNPRFNQGRRSEPIENRVFDIEQSYFFLLPSGQYSIDGPRRSQYRVIRLNSKDGPDFNFRNFCHLPLRRYRIDSTINSTYRFYQKIDHELKFY